MRGHFRDEGSKPCFFLLFINLLSPSCSIPTALPLDRSHLPADPSAEIEKGMVPVF